MNEPPTPPKTPAPGAAKRREPQGQMSLRDLYGSHDGKVSDKWSLYLDVYDRIFSEFRAKPIRLLEIGIQNGGSLEIWRQYFPQAEIILGCDINPNCNKLKFDDEKIAVIVGDANTQEVEKELLFRSTKFDIIIDDGSHNSSDIIKSFARYFPHLDDGGVYIAEDLHCSYRRRFGGGLYDPLSTMSFFKRLLDVVNREHWGLDRARADALATFAKRYSVTFDEASLASIYAVEFLNSLCILRRLPPAENALGWRQVVGREAIVDDEVMSVNHSMYRAGDETGNTWSLLPVTMEQEIETNRGLVQHHNERVLALDADLRREKEHSRSLEERLKERDLTIQQHRAERDRVIQQHREELNALNADLQRDKGHSRSLEAKLKERDLVIQQHRAERNRIVQQHRKELDLVARRYTDSNSWRITAPLRAFAGNARRLHRRGRQALTLAGWLATGQTGRAGQALLPYYRRHVPAPVKAMIPRSLLQGLKRRLNASGPKPPSTWARSPRSIIATAVRDYKRRKSHSTAHRRRIAIFASYSDDNTISDHVVYYLSELRKVVDAIVFVSDNPLLPCELEKIEHLVVHQINGRHGEYDFGSYKRGYLHAKQAGLLDKYDELILCNDSCFGPVSGFSTLFDVMSRKECDFWGITESNQFVYHLQSYFISLSAAAFRHNSFDRFLTDVTRHDTVQDVIFNYELKLTGLLVREGFRPAALITERPEITEIAAMQRQSIEHFPCFLARNGSPLIKVKGMRRAHCNLDGIEATFQLIRQRNLQLYNAVIGFKDTAKYLSTPEVAFSVVMASRNRAHCITDAIDSIFAQSHTNFELIIVDDGSTDGTGDLVRKRYHAEIASKKLIYIVAPEHVGVSAARNIGLRAARNPWVAYIDSDNAVRSYFLSVFAQHVTEYPDSKTFYAQFCRREDGFVLGKPFDYGNLLKGNFIDLGVFVHHSDCTKELGGFDENLKRLVDWDLILNYTRSYPPKFIPHVLMEYASKLDPDRVSVKEPLGPAWFSVLAKRGALPTVSTVILSYNQKDYIKEAIESALAQKGEFVHEIIISDDGSTDGTDRIIRQYSEKYPLLIRDVSSRNNVGISGNYKRGFAACSGEYIATLEGDDYWSDQRKLESQAAFLLENKDCSMVFSKIEVLNVGNGTTRFLNRQNALNKAKLNGQDFLDHPTMNLIGNFSCCLFRASLIKNAPPILFEKRLSEIALAFYLEKHGKIGYLNKPMSVYRQHPNGVWTGSSRATQLKGGLETRLVVKAVADARYKDKIQGVIDERYSVE
jgi:O-antigen biosynthesis protein